MPFASVPATFVTMKNQIDKMMPKFAGNSVATENVVTQIDTGVSDAMDAMSQAIINQTNTGVSDWLHNMRDMATEWRAAVW